MLSSLSMLMTTLKRDECMFFHDYLLDNRYLWRQQDMILLESPITIATFEMGTHATTHMNPFGGVGVTLRRKHPFPFVLAVDAAAVGHVDLPRKYKAVVLAVEGAIFKHSRNAISDVVLGLQCSHKGGNGGIGAALQWMQPVPIVATITSLSERMQPVPLAVACMALLGMKQSTAEN
ncbi:hypothetical protein CK203_034156 [Vitis vinifera]|uniref:Uncharacterized protein n=1 Tax=Vitis vinifera TaxID=29760 RepID=A0A438IF08_VITVI|nr:hypothetical protein CK203_034156 [Vitis vinifera]